MTETQTAKPSLLRRIWKVLDEFTPPSTPRPTPSKKEFAEGRAALGIVCSAVQNDAPEGGQMDDDLVIHIDTSDHGQSLTLPRTVMCPLPGPGAGQQLIGQQVIVRHTTLDTDYDNDILVARWPAHVTEALTPIRYEGPGTFRARIWNVLAGCFFVIGCAGVMFTPVLLCTLTVGLFMGTNLLADILPGLHPAVAAAVSVGVIPAGVFLGCVCLTRRDRLREGMTVRRER
ncbi:hypothetical protein [Gordonia humi]|uniref:Uncharacterized protein n=1 Tax=Gordonia humi TaxID=686429 RepID=A0A840ER46_9ACTN|nr:hypothetical protein [Gordonia humi]MBB4134001.1 hypothetical protein [Gordonia humi]